MVFQEKKITNYISLIYGFTNQEKDTYDFVLLLQRKLKVTYIHGMLSRVDFLQIYKELWIFLSRTVKTRYIGFEILLKHYRAYKYGLIIDKELDTKSFDGYPTKTLIIDKNKMLKIGM